MNDTPPPSEHRPLDPDSARTESFQASLPRAEPVSDVAGWPGAVLSSAGPVDATPIPSRDTSPTAIPPMPQAPPMPTTTTTATATTKAHDDSPMATTRANETSPTTAPSRDEAPTFTHEPTPPYVPPTVSQPTTRVEEVEAVPVTRSQVRGPAIRVEAQSRAADAGFGAGVPQPPPTAPASTTGGEPRPSSEERRAPEAATASRPADARSTASSVPPVDEPRVAASSSSRAPNSGERAASSNPPPTGGGAYGAAAAAVPLAHGGSRTWAVLGHLAYLVPLPPHVAGLVITVLVWVVRRRRDAFVEDQGRESLNFQLTYLALNALLGVTCVGSVFTPVVWLVGAVLCIVAAVHAGDGQRHRYPWIFRLIA